MLHNAHVVLFKGILCRMAQFQRRPMAQWFYYTEYMREIDPEWKPEHMAS